MLKNIVLLWDSCFSGTLLDAVLKTREFLYSFIASITTISHNLLFVCDYLRFTRLKLVLKMSWMAHLSIHDYTKSRSGQHGCDEAHQL